MSNVEDIIQEKRKLIPAAIGSVNLFFIYLLMKKISNISKFTKIDPIHSPYFNLIYKKLKHHIFTNNEMNEIITQYNLKDYLVKFFDNEDDQIDFMSKKYKQ